MKGIILMSVCKMYFVLLLLYAVINMLGERLQTAQTKETREGKRRSHVEKCFRAFVPKDGNVA